MDIWTRLGRYASFETERMYLRPFTYKDSQDFFEICSNPDNLRLFFQVVRRVRRVILSWFIIL